MGGYFEIMGDLLLGTEKDAEKKNEAAVERALAFMHEVPIEQLLAMARAQYTDAPEQTLAKFFGQAQGSYQQAIGAVGQAGTGANLQAQAAGTAAKGDAAAQLRQRGLFGSSLLTGAQQGIQQQTNQTMAGISGQTAGAQANILGQKGNLFAQQGQLTAGVTQNRQSALAGLYGLEADMLFQKGAKRADILGGLQYQGSPGFIQQYLSGVAGAAGGATGMAMMGGF